MTESLLYHLINGSEAIQAALKELEREAHELWLLSSASTGNGVTVNLGEQRASLISLLDATSVVHDRLHQETVKRYYRKLAGKFHPDGSAPTADAVKFSTLRKAYKAGNLEVMFLLLNELEDPDKDSNDTVISYVERQLAWLEDTTSFQIARNLMAGNRRGAETLMVEHLKARTLKLATYRVRYNDEQETSAFT